MTTPSPLAVLVLGMHRSGTSAVTGMLHRLGIPAAGELLPAESYNEKGIYENRAVNLFHNRLLNNFGSAWDDPMPVSNKFVETPAGQCFVHELAKIIENELLAEGSAFAVKDPRMCRFIPLWNAALKNIKAEPYVIVPLRHPLEVAGSLFSRDGFPRAKSFLLWLDHTLAAERHSRELPRSFISYDQLLSDWRSVSDKIADDLNLTWPSERGRVENGIDLFLSRDLRHHASSAEIGDATRLDYLVTKSWAALLALIENGTNNAAQQTLDAVWDELTAATSVLSSYVAWEFSAFAEARSEVDRLTSLETALRRDRDDTEVALRKALQDEHEAHARQLQNLDADLRKELQEEREAHAIQLQDLDANFKGELREVCHEYEGRLREAQEALNALHASTSWRVTAPLRKSMGALSPSTKNSLRRIAKAGWWTITPWRMPVRRKFLHERNRQASMRPNANMALPTPLQAALSPSRMYRRNASLQPAMGVFEVEGTHSRLSMVTDSINAGSLFGGVATALIFTALLAKRTGRRLRIITRTQAPAAENVATVFRAHGIEWTDNIEFAFADIHNDNSLIDVHPDEQFVTTSWWTTHSTRQSVADDRILYILQEDERMFYPFGDDYLACSETISDRRIRRVINSQLLHQHLTNDGVIDERTPYFEPSFPKRIYFPKPAPTNEKRNFFFYARPHNARNLYHRGVEVIQTAVERGILDPKKWNIHFVGKDLTPLRIAGGVEPILLQNLPWEEYAAYVRSVDLALTLMYTPHPSYPPLDVAACGGVAVTNSFGVKTDLHRYSRSIICTDSEVESLVEGLRLGIVQALDLEERKKALSESHLKRDWQESFALVFDELVEGIQLVR